MLQFDEETTKLKGGAVMTSQSTIEKLLRHDQTVVLISLGIVIAISWAYILLGAGMGMSVLFVLFFSETLSPLKRMKCCSASWRRR